MIAGKDNVYEAALRLPERDRAELVRRLLESLPEDYDLVAQMDPEIRQAWTEECRRRWEEYQRGEVEATDGDEVFRRILARYEQ